MNIEAKYADKVTLEYRMAMEAIAMFRFMLSPHRQQFEALLKAKRDMDNFGGLIDPTLYRDMLQSKGFAQQIKLVEAALVFLNVVDTVANEIEAVNVTQPNHR